MAVALVDPLVITGAPAWIKPLKFAISGGIYGASFLWLLTYIRGRHRWVQIAATVTGVALIVETALITLQVIRGTTSHFNVSTPFDAAVFSAMGGFITVLATFALVAGIWLIFQRMDDRAFAWSLRLAILVSFAGMMTGFLMTTQTTPAQAEQMATGTMVSAGAHSVGVEDGGPGLPFVGWSTTGGDLRVPHFVGLHALQIIPLVAWGFSRPALRRRLNDRRRTALVVIAGLGYLALLLILTWQALRGQSVVAPDSLTLAAFAGLSIATLGASAVILRRSPQQAG
jgi:hypothetical protein